MLTLEALLISCMLFMLFFPTSQLGVGQTLCLTICKILPNLHRALYQLILLRAILYSCKERTPLAAPDLMEE